MSPVNTTAAEAPLKNKVYYNEINDDVTYVMCSIYNKHIYFLDETVVSDLMKLIIRLFEILVSVVQGDECRLQLAACVYYQHEDLKQDELWQQSNV